MTREYLEKNYTVSSYNENTSEQLDYYIDENLCKEGDVAYLYFHEEKKIEEMEIVKIIRRSCSHYIYDNFIRSKDFLLYGESKYNADTSAEFITDNDCYLIWFKTINNTEK